MIQQDYQGADKVPALLNANTTPRYKRLERLESWVNGTQYNDRPCGWFEDAAPLWERRPCVVYKAVELAIGSYVDLIFGESRFPAFTSRPGEDEADDEAGLGEDDSKLLDRFIGKHHDLCHFPTYCREGLKAAMGTGTAVGIHGHRNGKPFAELVPSKWCTPTLDAEGKVLSLEIRYPYVDEYKKPDGQWAVRVRIYRRVIDTTKDTTFYPVDAKEDGSVPATWTVDPSKSVDHLLGFCPAVWYAHMKGCQPVNVIDGKAIHASTTDEIQAHDIARSQWHRCALLSEPQYVETGVSPGYNPTGEGRPALVPSTELGGLPGPHNPERGGYDLGIPNQGARKKGPGHVWSYPDKDTTVTAVTTPKDALEAQHANVSDLRLKVQEELCVVFLDPENIKFAATTSGKALEAIKQKQIDRCGQIRDDVRDHFLLPSIDIQLRIADRVGKDLKVPLVDKVLPIIKKFNQQDEPNAAPSAA
jgi:hypothetical protein